jgi:SAM-dependent methyltransferase
MVTPAEHWSATWTDRDPSEVSWFQSEPTTSVRLALALVPDHADAIVDVGGGVSRFALRMLAAGYSDVTVVDIAETALQRLRHECAAAGLDESALHTIATDVVAAAPAGSFALWHDRAGYHFLTDDEERVRYRAAMSDSVSPGGHAIMAMFGPDGPER